MKWCDRCKQQTYNRQHSLALRMSTVDVAANKAAATAPTPAEAGRAHPQDIVVSLNDDAPSDLELNVEKPSRDEIVTQVDGDRNECMQIAEAEQNNRSLHTIQQPMQPVSHDLHIHRWCIVRQRAELVTLRDAWWECCGGGVSAAIRNTHWTNLRVIRPRSRASHQRHADTMSSPQLQRTTEAALRRLLRSTGVPDVEALHCCVMKVLCSPPRAGRQKMHADVPSAAMIHHPQTRKETSERKAPRCLSILLHLNPGVTRGTHVPLLSAADMSPLMHCSPDEWSTVSEHLCRESNFVSHDMQGGDALVFYGDVAHFGPANPSDTKWRWVLYAMFSPEAGLDQDAKQEYFS